MSNEAILIPMYGVIPWEQKQMVSVLLERVGTYEEGGGESFVQAENTTLSVDVYSSTPDGRFDRAVRD